MRHFVTGVIAFLVLASSAIAAPTFPPLTGRVVDAANVLSPAQEQTLSSNLEAFEQTTKHQLVVVTLPSLQGYEIDAYGYQLGRYWGIGDKQRNDGVLLIVAPNERQLRIEVGYGLEGDLTDLQSNQIIQSVMVPEFKRGDLPAGITNGARAIIGMLGGEPYAMPRSMTASSDEIPLWVVLLFIAFILFMRVRFGVGVLAVGSYGSGWNGGGGFTSGGGFSGGGGSFGGGGSSGRW